MTASGENCGTDLQVGYCTNVHAGADLETTQENLRHYALAIKEQVRPNAPMGIGLWLSAAAARNLIEQDQAEIFSLWLRDHGLLPFTLNGFPHGDFHQKVVKHRVYEPTWYEQARLDYTLDLIEIHDALLPEGMDGSISTLPICWGDPNPGDEKLQQAAGQLQQVAQRLAELEKQQGRKITVCLEPEPGCVLQRSDDVLDFYQKYLLPGGNEAEIRSHICVCHDVCHAAVMFEDQVEVLKKFHAAGIGVGKVQVSSAVCLSPEALSQSDRELALEQLSQFSEDKYLHQTVIQQNGQSQFYEDLPLALAAQEQPDVQSGPWCVHFHVPIYLERFGLLGTSRDQIEPCVRTAMELCGVTHFEVETYAWGVLPEQLKQPDLASGIIEELQWFDQLINKIGMQYETARE